MTTYELNEVLQEHGIPSYITRVGVLNVTNSNWIFETNLLERRVAAIRRSAFTLMETEEVQETDRKILTICTLLGIEVSPL